MTNIRAKIMLLLAILLPTAIIVIGWDITHGYIPITFDATKLTGSIIMVFGYTVYASFVNLIYIDYLSKRVKKLEEDKDEF